MQRSFIEEHNAEAKAVWDAFDARLPIRPPVALGTATQSFIFNDDLNPGEAITFEHYCADADAMLEFQLAAAKWRSENIAPHCDDPVGMPPNREANNFAPCTPPENLAAMYETARCWGGYRGD
jgi:hypothetical protein